MFENCFFTYVNNIKDYNNLIDKNIFVFYSFKNTDKINGYFLDKKINLFDCFYYFYKNNNHKKYVYFSCKSILKNNYNIFFENDENYINYNQEYIYFLKYKDDLYEIFDLFSHNINHDNFINFLSNYFSCFKHHINDTFVNKFVLPKSKLVYNIHAQT